MHRQHPSPKYKKQSSRRPAHRQRTLRSKDNQTGTRPGMHQNLHGGHAKKPSKHPVLPNVNSPANSLTQSSTKTQENSWKCDSYGATQSTLTCGANHTPKNLDALPKAYRVPKGQTPLCSSSTMKYHSTEDGTSHMEKR
jgi:hypothetical protein